MAYTNINKPSNYFNTKLYTGTGATQSISGVNFQPDLVWIKNRQDTYNNHLFDVIRGVQKEIRTDDTTAESTISGLTSFDSDGFTLGSAGNTNFNGNNHVSWNWLGGGTGVSNTDGSITSTVSANTTSGFSIVKWTGTGSVGTIGHGIGKEVKFFITKRTDFSGDNWYAYHSSLGGTKYLHPNKTEAAGTAISPFNNTNATSTTISAGTDLSVSSSTHIAYCFAEVKGFSKMGSYVGNGSTDGTFIYTGFRPAFFLVKNTSAIESWYIIDNRRPAYNTNNYYLLPNTTGAEGTSTFLATSLLSNGVKIENADTSMNTSGQTYIYMAFAESPLVSSTGVPCTAR